MFGFAGLLFVVFLVLKLIGVIAWSWLWITAPLWIAAILFVIAFAFMVLAIGKEF
ncbi:hypothetical protein KIV65_gp31 [Mycobacterium phage Anthony]|uniref:Uncharacterized protein n=1 Tax=Mycobacterium phage Anthony TaxID=2599857 RepID=A0A5J6TIL5_9CAUD|nr:hypothetical protein KIV65_gp31 [Mycobacterium phage Anthony]QFG10436.1 hypothetical protein PBI_ANTHONY_66 [Mycobacterium phage Anthony]